MRYTKLLTIIGTLCFLGGGIFWYLAMTEHGRVQWEEGVLFFYRRFGDPLTRRCEIPSYGAKTGETADATQGINQAIIDCARKGGGTVVVPAGEWYTGAIKLASHITLHLEEGAVLNFRPNVHEYLPVVFTRFQGMELYNYASLIYGYELDAVAITGPGKLIGNGEAREAWDGGGDFSLARAKLYDLAERGVPTRERVFGDQFPGIRPSFVQCVRCTNVLLDGFTVENGPFWTIHLVYSKHIVARNLHINTWSINTDGIVLDSSSDVLIEDSYFATGDDAIAIKSGVDADGRRVGIPSENIEIRRVQVTQGNGGVSLGSEMSGGIRSVTIRDSLFENTGSGFRMKANESRGGFFEDILVENITMRHVINNAINIDFQYHSALESRTKVVPVVKNVVVRNITGSEVLESVINIDGQPNLDLGGLRLENISFDKVVFPVRLEFANHVMLDTIAFSGTNNTAYVLEESKNVQLIHGTCQTLGWRPCVRVLGARTKDIELQSLEFVPGHPQVVLDPSVIPSEVTVQ